MPQRRPDPTIGGHPAIILDSAVNTPVVITVCAECGSMRSVLWLTADRWFCNACKASGAKPPNMYPVS